MMPVVVLLVVMMPLLVLPVVVLDARILVFTVSILVFTVSNTCPARRELCHDIWSMPRYKTTYNTI